LIGGEECLRGGVGHHCGEWALCGEDCLEGEWALCGEDCLEGDEVLCDGEECLEGDAFLCEGDECLEDAGDHAAAFL
jgi:hypothetical protein